MINNKEVLHDPARPKASSKQYQRENTNQPINSKEKRDMMVYPIEAFCGRKLLLQCLIDVSDHRYERIWTYQKRETVTFLGKFTE